MHVGTCKITIRIAENQDLKGKRRIVKSLCDHLHHQFNVAVAEVDAQDLWQTAIIGIACVSNDSRHVRQALSKIIAHITEKYQGEFELINSKQEIISGL